jgi:hypothetical protein
MSERGDDLKQAKDGETEIRKGPPEAEPGDPDRVVRPASLRKRM